MKHLPKFRTTLIVLSLLCTAHAYSQGVGINNAGGDPHPSAGLDVDFTNKGLLLPRMTEAQRDNIADPAEGLIIFNTTSGCFNVYQGTEWYQWCATCIPPESPTAGSNSPLCAGETLELSATSSVPGVTFSWVGPAGFSSASPNPVLTNVNPGQSGIYSVATTLNGCTTAPVQVQVTVTQQPAQPSAIDGPTCLEQDQLTDVAYSVINIPGVIYNWVLIPDEGAVVTPSGNTCTITYPEGVNSYTLTVTPSVNGCEGSSRQIQIDTKVLCSVNYANGNEAYWGERNLGFRDVSIAGGSVIYSYNAETQQYTNGNSILIPNLVATPDGQTVNALSFYGFSGGSADDGNYQWDGDAIPEAYRGPDYHPRWDRHNMFVSPSFTGLTFCQVLQYTYTGSCYDDGLVTIEAPVVYPDAEPGPGSYAIWFGEEFIEQGNVNTGVNIDKASQQSLESGSYCTTMYGKGWRIPTDVEVGHRSNECGIPGDFDQGYITPGANDYFYTSSAYCNDTDVNGRSIYEPGYGWNGGGVQGETYFFRCVFSTEVD